MKKSATLLALFTLLSCSDSTGPAGPLIGRWETLGEDIGGGYTRVEVVDFRSDGTLQNEMRIYRSGHLDTTYRFTFMFTVHNDSLFTNDVVLALDRLNSVGWTKFNRGRFVIDRLRLTITYPWIGPADESIMVTTVFYRDLCMRRVTSRCL